MPHRRADKRSSAANVVAATAGLNSWKTWAGREHGENDFETLDLVRGLRRKFNRKFVWSVPPPGTACPVCFVEPDGPSDGGGDGDGDSNGEWHVTSSCGHAVCLACLRAYAKNQVRDSSHFGPLKCPICPLPLRESDAIRALEDDPETIRKWDDKIRDQVLRALPSYRHCPRCSSDSESRTTQTALTGGGFVTPECLTPINKDRELDAEWLLGLVPLADWVLVGAYFAFLFSYARVQTESIFVAVLNAFAPLWILHRLRLLCNMLIARAARQALYKPIVVECPCCDEDFILNAEAELSPSRNAAIADEATAEWIGTNTRPCPSCSVPISKASGCNHMRCSHCRASFCWACMRLRTRCAAFECNNGAPFGNSSIGDGGEDDVGGGGEGGIVDRIARLESRATRLDRRDAIALLALFTAVFWRDSVPVQVISKVLVTSFSIVFSTGFVISCIAVGLMAKAFLDELENRQRGQRVNTQPTFVHRPQRVRSGRLREDQMLAEALARSLREQ